jgi:hypothetical protein
MKRGGTPLQSYTKELTRIFKRASNKHEAHRQSRRILLDMAADPACIRCALATEIRRPGGLNTRHYPSVSLPIEHNAHFNLVANCFLPLPDGATNITANAVHHHGHLLLTTVTAFGPGYEHWRFTTPKAVDLEKDIYSIELIDRQRHAAGESAFVDSFMPHAVIYPASLTVTFALWSSQNEVTWRDHVKKLPGLEARRESLLRVVRRLGLWNTFRLNVDGYFDYYPVGNGFKGMRKRIQFERGPNEDYLYTLFHILQQTDNEDLAPDEQLLARVPVDNPWLVRRLAREMDRGIPIACRFSEGLHWLDHMNFKVEEIERALEMAKEPTRRSLQGTV